MKKLFALLALLFAMSSCERGEFIKGPSAENGHLSVSMNKSTIPDEVQAIRGMLFKANMDTIYFEFVMDHQHATALVEDIPVDLWTLKVDAYNSVGEIIYSGSTKIRLVAGEITPVQLNLTQIGGIEITVTWGDKNDRFEENDDLTEAKPLTEFRYYQNLNISPSDDDWYSMRTSADSLAIRCNFTHADGDINIKLVDSNGIVLAAAESTTDNEKIDYITTHMGTFYIHIYQVSGASTTYTIWWDDIWQGE